MKNVSVAILAFLYLAVSCGIVMHVHYCMGKVSSVDLSSKSDTCGKCGMKKSPGCCDDAFKVIKLKDAHNLAGNGTPVSAPAGIAQSFPVNIACLAIQPPLCAGFNNHSPPVLSRPSLNILHCIFRI